MKKAIFFLLITALIFSCKHSEPAPPVHEPTVATLLFPAQNSLCNTGTITSATQASVLLTWQASDYTNSYIINIKNLNNGNSIRQTITGTQFSTTLLRGMPYAWYIVSKSSTSADTAATATWKFYMAGIGITTYSPFPAELVSPSFFQSVPAGTTSVNLSWTGSDVDNDIAGYDVYFGSSSNPPLLQSGDVNMYLENVPVSANTTYYWKIVTKDTAGNTSISDISQFVVN